MKFREFITEQTDFQKKDFSVEYDKYDRISKLTVNRKLVKGFSLSISEYSKMEFRQFMYSKPQKFYISSFRRSEIILDKEIWDSVKEVKNVRF
jgi:hypothetical protein